MSFPLRRAVPPLPLAPLLLFAAAGCGAKEESPEPPPVPTSVPATPDPGGAAPRPAGAAPVVSASSADDAPDADAALVARFAGTYTRESYGHRVMVVRPNGTATMTVDVDPFYQWMTGPRITVEIAWELTGEPGDETRGVHFASVSGTPESSFKAVTQLFGTEADWRIESADDRKLVLYDPEDEETVEWTRVPDAAG